MATLGAEMLTLADWAKRQDPNNKIARIAELLSQTNDMLDDMPMAEANEVTSHLVTVRTGLPTPVWRLLNQGVTPTKSTTAQLREAMGICEDWTETDTDLAELGGNKDAFMASELSGKFQGMTQEVASTLIYGNAATAPEEFTGLAPRFADLSANNGENIIDGAGTGSDNSSIWLIVWGPNSCFTIYPKGSMAGLKHRNLGPGVVETTAGVAGNRMYAYRHQIQWKIGLVLKDWRYVVRAANIDISNLVAKSSAADLIDIMIKMLKRPPNLNAGKPCFYMNATCEQMLDIQRRDDATALDYQNIDGRVIPHFRGVPIRRMDALTETESQIA